MDVKRESRVAVNTGKVDFGLEEAIKDVNEDKCELLIVASNCPEERLRGKKEFKGVPIYRFNGNNKSLGSAAGKPFAPSILSVLDPGESNILSIKAE